MLEAHRMPRGDEAVARRNALHERTRAQRKRHTALQFSAPREMIDDQRCDFAFPENASLLVYSSDAVGVSVGGEPQAQAALRAHAPREFAQSPRRGIGNVPAERRIAVEPKSCDSHATLAQCDVERTCPGAVERVVEDARLPPSARVDMDRPCQSFHVTSCEVGAPEPARLGSFARRFRQGSGCGFLDAPGFVAAHGLTAISEKFEAVILGRVVARRENERSCGARLRNCTGQSRGRRTPNVEYNIDATLAQHRGREASEVFTRGSPVEANQNGTADATYA